jgi:hypothetical protein
MIIGVAPVYGDGLLISDTRAEFTLMAKPRYADCIQKIHYVGPNVIAGFSGSVKLGFRQIAELKKQLGPAKPEYGWNIDQIAGNWLPRLFRSIFDQSEADEKQLDSNVLLVAAHPHKTHGGSDEAWMDAVRFCSPVFEAEKSSVNQPIGIGILNEEFQATVKEVLKHQFSIQMLFDQQSDQAAAIAGIVKGTYQIGLINRGKSTIITTDTDLRVADRYGAYIKYCAENHLEPACAVA